MYVSIKTFIDVLITSIIEMAVLGDDWSHTHTHAQNSLYFFITKKNQ